ncbi:Zn-dependent hydrolase of the beta-lactamase fold-like protein [Neorhizobium galegae bv. officinalis]|uniref:Zn-dependent hydrolase of the beta-lactamase fold-like protein n=1 Tax=Neorhizobium galegae bv. officinalis TaxID=323656 RepID=A0A0T7FJ93_NEOGA|nr:MBL fold metallo-hydrolase [Neorhizobium galegae]CDZ35061.1 Zn-dependent hydrolase of the beta-lactamase fold-like protein [Neorhizobium galegae bv. officinalis]
MMLRALALGLSGLLLSAFAALPQDGLPISQCQAIAQKLPGVTFASFNPSDLQFVQARRNLALADREEVKITFVGHSTYFIETPEGIGIATDYSGAYRPSRLPDVATMNKAHSTHFTLSPDSGIKHVLHGWSDVPGEKAQHRVMVGDVYVRNVVSDIRNWGGGIEENGNSIFIFEVAGLCIGHLGHLHFELNEAQYTEIGRLDILMVPVDGGLTMGADSMSRVVQRLRSSLILPMHRWGPPLDNFIAMFDAKFDIAYAKEPTIRVSMRSLPKKPTILVPQGL